MDLNATLLGQMITFGIFIWFTMKFVWPMLEKVLNERKTRIADGLIAAEKGNRVLDKAEEEAKETIKEAKGKSEKIISQARRQSLQIIEEARVDAQKEKNDIIIAGKNQLKQSLHLAKTHLQSEVAKLAMEGAQKIIERSISEDDHKDILDKISKDLLSKIEKSK